MYIFISKCINITCLNNMYFFNVYSVYFSRNIYRPKFQNNIYVSIEIVPFIGFLFLKETLNMKDKMLFEILYYFFSIEYKYSIVYI